MQLKRLVLMVALSLPVMAMECPGIFDPFLGPGGGTAVIDGNLTTTANEWDDAFQFPVSIANPPHGTIDGTLYMMNNAENLFVAVVFPSAPIASLGVDILLDVDHSESVSLGDDDFSYATGGGSAGDFTYIEVTSGGIFGPPTTSITSRTDVSQGGTLDAEGAHTDSGDIVIEMSHPLRSGDPHDWRVRPGDMITFQFQYFFTPSTGGLGFGSGAFTEFPLASAF